MRNHRFKSICFLILFAFFTVSLAGCGGSTVSTTKGFAITGTWKNTGSYTYGQAQSGAIIVFDGSRCNFFSPSDTYAFYAEGDHYRLDCTSPLGDTVSFTVRIVDENHIDIFNGQNIVELTRIVQ